MNIEEGGIYVCEYCHRILAPDETRVQQTVIGGIRLPKPHTDDFGENCGGNKAEVIAPWRPL